MRPHEVITDEGLFFKGIVLDLPPEKLVPLRQHLIRTHGVDPKLIVIDREKKRIEMYWRLTKTLAKREPALKFALVEEYPTHDRLETTVAPL
jgi:pyruvate formate-lyase activating enzyme-like uncharacterized protein